MAQTTPVPHTDHDTKEEDVHWEKLLKWLAPVSAGILALSVLFLWVINKDSGLRAEVAQAYSLAQSAEALEAIAEVYPDQPEAPLALLQAASLRFDEKAYSESQAIYASFLDAYPAHPLKENAQWGLWMCTEQLGDLDAALEGFSSVTDDQLLYPQALLARARVFEKQKDPQAALDVYTQIQDNFPLSPWAEQARVFSEQVELERASPDA